MKHRLSCEFNIDTAGVKLKYSDGSMISIDCTAVENQVETILGMNKGGFLLSARRDLTENGELR